MPVEESSLIKSQLVNVLVTWTKQSGSEYLISNDPFQPLVNFIKAHIWIMTFPPGASQPHPVFGRLHLVQKA